MGLGELLAAAAASPWLLAVVVLVGVAVWAVEKLAGLNGVFTRIGAAWTDRELNRLRREALLRAERRRIELADASPEVTALRARVEELGQEVAALREQLRADADAADARAAAAAAYDRRMLAWAFDLYSRARAAGLHADPPPEPAPVP